MSSSPFSSPSRKRTAPFCAPDAPNKDLKLLNRPLLEPKIFDPTILSLDNLIIEEILGKGTEGTVYHAMFPKSEINDIPPTHCAVKMQPYTKHWTPKLFARMYEQFVLLHQSCAALIYRFPILGLYETEFASYLVMERTEGYNLENRKLGARSIWRLLFDICMRHLRPLHEAKFVHLDIKPANIMFNRITRRYALIDYNLLHTTESKDPVQEGDGKYASLATLNATSYESLKGSQCDIYSLLKTVKELHAPESMQARSENGENDTPSAAFSPPSFSDTLLSFLYSHEAMMNSMTLLEIINFAKFFIK